MTKILLVDDEDLIRFALSRTLKQGDTDVTAVTNGKDALLEIQGGSYDICLLDVQLPDANGLDLMKIIRDISPSTSVIIMTAGILTDAQQRSLRDHGCHFFPKPIDLNLLHSIVADLSRHPVAGRE